MILRMCLMILIVSSCQLDEKSERSSTSSNSKTLELLQKVVDELASGSLQVRINRYHDSVFVGSTFT